MRRAVKRAYANRTRAMITIFIFGHHSSNLAQPYSYSISVCQWLKLYTHS